MVGESSMHYIHQRSEKLRQAGRLCILGASKACHYNDSEHYQLQIGYSGVNTRVTRQYKRVSEQSLKQVLVELWAMTPELRDPRLLEDLHGIEVSLSTGNAQRVPLAQIIQVKCVDHILRDFDWGELAHEDEFKLTLQNPARPRRHLGVAWKENFDAGIMLRLKMLSPSSLFPTDGGHVLQAKCS